METLSLQPRIPFVDLGLDGPAALADSHRETAEALLHAGRQVVPEIFQQEVTPERLGGEVAHWLDDPQACAELERLFGEIHLQLRRGASDRAAEAVLRLIEGKRDRSPCRGTE